MNNNSKISVIVPVYNISEYVEKCIISICNQTYKNLEIIVVDDGSTDGSDKICDKYSSFDSRITVVHKKNEGVVRARKDGLSIATGTLILYVDGDDWIEPNMIERLYEVLESNDVDIAMCGRFENTGDARRAVYHGIQEGRYDKHDLHKKVYPNMIVNGCFFEWGIFPGLWDKLFKRECLEEFQMAVDDRITMGEDAACTYPALLNADSVYVLHECLYHYRQSANSMVKQNNDIELQRKRFYILYNSVRNSLEKYVQIYDLRKQWKEYVLFLMIPRADMLYKDIEKLDYLFPFTEVKRNSNIIIYGMGTYGQLLYKFITKSKFCNIVLCVDRNYKELSKLGLPVVSAEKIRATEYDHIIIANTYYKSRNKLYNDLILEYPINKIHMIDEKLLKSSDSLKAFGIIDD